jgi:lipopolysaccharide/colanic/teichoic acid biosynthesis glycosyltransferase
MGPQFSLRLLTKEILDYIGAVVLVIISFPVILISALLIKITSPGSVLYRHQRCGLQGRTFTLYKLRTMHCDSDKRRAGLKGKNIMKGPAFKIDNDPRVTAVGRFLRKFSIDELPQFWNVLKGEMSLIGPRPPVPEEVCGYTGWQRRRLSMRPGITGLWQVSGRSHVTDFNKLAVLDLKYIDNWSLKLDFKIFLKTIWVVFSTRGAK